MSKNLYLAHYNHNHDRLGRFARSTGAAASSVGGKVLKSKKKQAAPNPDIKKGKAANTKLSESDRNRIVNRGSAKEVQKYKDRLSTRELETAVNRLNQDKTKRVDLERQLSSLSEPKAKRRIEKAADWMERNQSTIKKINDFADQGIRMYNNYANINNAFSTEKMPVIETGGKKKKNKNKNKG